MRNEYALLLLTEPPQYTHPDDVHLAFHPTLVAAVERLTGSSSIPRETIDNNSNITKIFLDVALPITRLIRESADYDDLVNRATKILTSLYRLLSIAVAQKQHLHQDTTLIPDIAIILIHETNPEDTIPHLPLAIQDLKAFAQRRRPWSRLFYVDNPQGDQIYRSLRTLSGTIPVEVHESAVRLPSGIQMFTPGAVPRTLSTDINLGHGAARQQLTFIIQQGLVGGTLSMRSKFGLTSELLTLPGYGDNVLRARAFGKQSVPRINVMISGDSWALEAVRAFLSTVLGEELGDSNQAQDVKKSTSLESVLSDGTLISISKWGNDLEEESVESTERVKAQRLETSASSMQEKGSTQVLVEDVATGCVASPI